MSLYIHLIEGKPAYFSQRMRSIVRAHRRISGARSYAQIRRERRISWATAARYGATPVKYGALKIT